MIYFTYKNDSCTIFLFFIYLIIQCNSSEVTDLCASCNASVADFVPYTAWETANSYAASISNHLGWTEDNRDFFNCSMKTGKPFMLEKNGSDWAEVSAGIPAVILSLQSLKVDFAEVRNWISFKALVLFLLDLLIHK